MATNALMDSLLQQRQWVSKDENARTEERKGRGGEGVGRRKKASEEVTRKLSHGSPCLQQPYFITQRRSLGGNQAYLAILVSPLPLPQSNYYSPVFYCALPWGKWTTVLISSTHTQVTGVERVCASKDTCSDAFVYVLGEASECKAGGQPGRKCADHLWAIGCPSQSH